MCAEPARQTKKNQRYELKRAEMKRKKTPQVNVQGELQRNCQKQIPIAQNGGY